MSSACHQQFTGTRAYLESASRCLQRSPGYKHMALLWWKKICFSWPESLRRMRQHAFAIIVQMGFVKSGGIIQLLPIIFPLTSHIGPNWTIGHVSKGIWFGLTCQGCISLLWVHSMGSFTTEHQSMPLVLVT